MSKANTSAGKKGFTLIEILLVIAAISILASIVIVAINPAKQLAQARNAQRTSNVNTILNAVWQYALDNNGVLPLDITVVATEICTATQVTPDLDCITDYTPDLINLYVLIDDEEYIPEIPADPQCPEVCEPDGIGYTIVKSANGRVTVAAPDTETTWGATVISVTR